MAGAGRQCRQSLGIRGKEMAFCRCELGAAGAVVPGIETVEFAGNQVWCERKRQKPAHRRQIYLSGKLFVEFATLADTGEYNQPAICEFYRGPGVCPLAEYTGMDAAFRN